MYDIHNHILAGIDDGCDNFETSIQMCKTARNDGIRNIVATPHYIPGYSSNPSAQIIKDMVKELNDNAEKQDIGVNIFTGMEVFISPNLPELYKSGEILTLNDSRYMLVELPLHNLPIYIDQVMFRLQVCGVVPVIAHPERNRLLRKNPKKMVEMADRGILFQINAGSFKGIFGEKVREFAFHLLAHGLVHLVASDAHSNSVRRPEIKEVYEIIRMRDWSRFERIVENSYKIIWNKEITSEHIVMQDKKKTNFNLMHLLDTVIGK